MPVPVPVHSDLSRTLFPRIRRIARIARIARIPRPRCLAPYIQLASGIWHWAVFDGRRRSTRHARPVSLPRSQQTMSGSRPGAQSCSSAGRALRSVLLSSCLRLRTTGLVEIAGEKGLVSAPSEPMSANCAVSLACPTTSAL